MKQKRGIGVDDACKRVIVLLNMKFKKGKEEIRDLGDEGSINLIVLILTRSRWAEECWSWNIKGCVSKDKWPKSESCMFELEIMVKLLLLERKGQGNEHKRNAEVERRTNHYREAVKKLRSQSFGKFTCMNIEISKNNLKSNV